MGFLQLFIRIYSNKAIGKPFYLFLPLLLMACTSASSQVTYLINAANNGDFESGSANWTIVNGSQKNKWYIGSSFKCSSANGAYVGSSSTVNNYDNGKSSTVHLYRDVVFPAGFCQLSLSFDYRGVGQSTKDYMRVYIVPTSTTPAAGSALPAASGVGNTYYQLVSVCTGYSISLNPALAGTTQRLVFSWINDGSGGSDPAALLDNVVLTASPATSVPTGCASIIAPLNNAIFSCNSSILMSWNAVSCASSYQLFLGTSSSNFNVLNGVNVGNTLSYNPGTLLPNTTYYWKVVPVNSNGVSSCSPSVYAFTTGANCFLQSNGVTYNTCSGTFYDSGGSASNYGNNESSVTTLCPGSPGQYVQLAFTSLNVEANNDLISVFNGRDATINQIATFTGTSFPCGNSTLTSTDTSGCLSLRFNSNGSVNASGWAATISCVSSPPANTGSAGSICSNAVPVNLPVNYTSHTTACYGNQYTNTSQGSCASLYESGEDRVYALNIPQPCCISVSLTGASTPNIGYMLYSGCPGSAGAACLGFNGGSSSLTSSFSINSAGTYYLIVDTWAPPLNATYNLSVSVTGSVPSNDLPCSATVLPLGVNATGDNSCSASLFEPGVPSCWTTGARNTVWYQVVAPPSGRLKIRTTLGTNNNTQIALYAGTCSILTLVSCNQDAPSCGSSSYANSEISATGLVAGATYYIAVDGANNVTGRFDIIAVDGNGPFPALAGQDCGFTANVCSPSLVVGNPGYQGYGNNCDFQGTGTCLGSGERAVVWYTVPISASGALSFDIIPNNWPGAPSLTSTDYDFAVWKIAGRGATSCAGISAGAVPVACNYSALGVTGLYGTLINTAPPAYPGFGAAYTPQLNVDSGDVYVIAVSNYSNSTSGFTLNFGATSPISYATNPTSVSWSGGTNNTWAATGNWGGCASPQCNISASIGASSLIQPVLSGINNAVENLTINPGATLTLLPNTILTVCGNFTNYGSLMADPSSTIVFSGSGVQSISGNLIGSDRFPNFTITKSTGSVVVVNDIDVAGSLTTSSATSILNTNGKYIRVAGHFINAAGSATYSNIGSTGTLEFNGANNQNYYPGGLLELNKVVLNQSVASSVTLFDDMVLQAGTGNLLLINGKIITNGEEVFDNNVSPLSISVGNANSYIQGKLRRKLQPNATGSYELPVGEATKGYQRATIAFTTPTTIDQLSAEFKTYASIPAALNIGECNALYDRPALDNGFWEISALDNSNSVISGSGNGLYDITLYNLAGSYTNNAGSAWTVMKDSTHSGNWGVFGLCDPSSTVNRVSRTQQSGFSWFATAQGGSTLPVTWLSFEGHRENNNNVLNWSTASEFQNERFDVMRSSSGVDFQKIGEVRGSGTVNERRDYRFIDRDPVTKDNYYRLTQVDFDGHQNPSDIILIRTNSKQPISWNIHPNPSTGRISVSFPDSKNLSGIFQIKDIAGKTVFSKALDINTGVSESQIDLGMLSPGYYAAFVQENGGQSYPPIMLLLDK